MSTRDLRLLPKASLHVHLEGCMRPSTLAELAAGYGVPVPATRGYGSFAAFAGLYDAAARCVRSEADLRRVVREVVEDAAADGAVWVEPQLWPHYDSPLLGDSGLVLDVALDEGRATAARLGVGFGLMVTAIRVLPPEHAEALAELAVTRAEGGVVSFGLAHDEVLGPPAPFARAFAVARAGGLVAAPHAGELLGPDSVRSALDDLGARRVAHGVRALEDPALVERLAAERVCLDVCPTSNALLGVVPSLPEHPLARLLEAGVACSVGPDDSLLFGPGLLEEYQTCRTALGLDDAQLAAVARSGIEAAAHAPSALVSGALERVEAWLTS
ncbi:adenosine deaminase [Quadrisphaera sp. KR29]|uniref:adenosine deaminase n=1 Tax=Quadrisphaera sp. KR29 TaxID=3461391 RepID=UPI004044B52B